VIVTDHDQDEAIAVLIDGVTEFGITHVISANLARHVLAVLHDARYAVEKLPAQENLTTDPATGTRRATFGVVKAAVYSDGTWLLMDATANWTDDDDPHAAAVGLLAGARWAQQEAAT
jgi:hypothetical protein